MIQHPVDDKDSHNLHRGEGLVRKKGVISKERGPKRLPVNNS